MKTLFHYSHPEGHLSQHTKVVLGVVVLVLLLALSAWLSLKYSPYMAPDGAPWYHLVND
jgi:hypothetical protein